MAAEPTDDELVAAALSGDTTSFGQLLKRHAPKLLSLARQMVGADAAEDVVQEAMIDAYRGLPGFRGDAAVGTWLHRVTVNRCLAERRRRKPEKAETEPLNLLRRWQDPDYSVDPALVAARRSRLETLRAVLDQLPENYRIALVLHDGQGLSTGELAEAMGVPLGTAKSYIRRGRMALVSLLGEQDLDDLEEAP
jgi:RNA polymerase sigma-70 factor (ECF subfamily)